MYMYVHVCYTPFHLYTCCLSRMFSIDYKEKPTGCNMKKNNGLRGVEFCHS